MIPDRVSTNRSRFQCLLVLTCIALGLYSSAFAQETDSLDRNYADELPRIAPLEPEDALDSFEIHDDFRIELAAAEPLVRDPIAMAFDEAGRLFVVEMRGYSEHREENIGEIRMLTDVDDDGVYDRATTYVGGLAWPTAVACFDGGIFVGAAPDILYCKDTDGDGRADTQEVVFTGFHLTNVQGLLNTFKWSLDNRIHGATSSSGAEVLRADSGDLPLSLRGRDFSFDPWTRTIRAESGGAQHGLSFDDFGRKYISSNSDHILTTHYEDRYFARNPYYAPPQARESIASDGAAADVFRISPVEPWRIVRTRLRVQGLVPGPIEGGGTAAGYFTSATGVTIYKGDAWPEQYRGNAFIGDVGSNLVHRKTLAYDGIEVRAHRADPNTEFLRSRDIWFRPAQFCNGPDGNLYIADMYREVIEHPSSLPPIIKQHLDLTSGNDRGRIYRIVPKEYARRPQVDFGAMTTVELARQLDHPNVWHSETAARLLCERNDKTVAATLSEVARRSSNPIGRIRARYVLERLDVLNGEIVAHALRDPDPAARIHALRLAESHPETLSAAADLLAHDDALSVRLQTTFSLGAIHGEAKIDPLAVISKSDGGEPLVRAAVMSSVSGYGAELLLKVTEESSTGIHHELLIALAREAGATSSKAALEAVLDRSSSWPGAQARAVLEAVIRGLAESARGSEARELLQAREQTRQLYADMMNRANALATNESAPVNQRIDAVRTLALGEFDAIKQSLIALLDNREAQGLQLAAVDALRKFDAGEVPQAVIAQWPSASPRVRSEMIELMFSKPVWLLALLDAVADRRINAAHLDSLRKQNLRDHPDQTVRTRAKAVLDLENARPDRDEVIAAYRSVIETTGDSTRGRNLFAENCAQCHRIGDLGTAVGPDLVTVREAGREELLTHILDPSREINPQYAQYVVETQDWLTHTGIIASETATSITLKRAHGETDTILRRDIESITSTNLSLMPEGWEEGLDNQDLADLLTFLTTGD